MTFGPKLFTNPAVKTLAIVLVALLAPCLLQAGDIKITAARKRVDASQAKMESEYTNSSEEKWRYEAQLVNGGFKPAPPLKARYIIFVQRQELGGKPGTETVEKLKGEAEVAALASHANGSFATNEVLLHHGSLVGERHYPNGGRIKAQDVILGIWIKLFDGTTEVGEYVNPHTLTVKNKWEE